MDSETNHESSQKSHKIFGDLNIFSSADILFTEDFRIFGHFMNVH